MFNLLPGCYGSEIQPKIPQTERKPQKVEGFIRKDIKV